MVQITLEVTNPELNDLEDLIVCWNLCDKHKQKINARDEDYFRFTQSCKKCLKINRKIKSKSLHLWSKLVTAYMQSTKRKNM